MNIFDPLVSGSLSVSGSAQISGSLTVLGNISGITSNALTSSYVEYNNVANKPSLISGSGTLNYIPKFTGANSLGNSLIFDNGTNVLIGTTSTPTPVVGVAFPLTVTSPNTTRIRIDSTQATPNSGFGLYANSVQKWSIAMFGATSDFTIYNDALLASAILVKGTNSNVLIGTTTDANFKLDVNGTGRFNTSLTVGAGGLTGRLSVRGTTNDSSAFAFEAANSSGNSLFVVRNDGAATFSNLVNAGTSGTVQGQLTLFSTTANAEGNIYGRNGGGMLLNTNANAHPIEFGGSRIQFNSNVGIGTTSIPAKISILVPSSSVNQQGLDITNAVDASFNVSLRTGITEITAGGTGNMLFSNSGGERMRITSGGNVLIGTTTDAGFRLDVNGTGRFSGNLTVRNNGYIFQNEGSVSNNGIVTVATTNTGGGGFQGFMIVTNSLTSNAAQRTFSTYSYFGRGTSVTFTLISTNNGPSGGASFTLSCPSNGVIQATNTSGGICDLTIQLFGGSSI
jgi:hypothetical protein